MRASSPLRHNGIYRYRDQLWSATHLSTRERAWGSTALMPHPWEAPPREILYLRHADGAILDARDFQPVGTLAELEDTGQDADD